VPKATTETLHAGAVIVATGHREMDPAAKYELGYGKYEGIFTQAELARLLAINGPTSGRLEDPVTGKAPRRLVMVQCVGSRDEKPGPFLIALRSAAWSRSSTRNT